MRGGTIENNVIKTKVSYGRIKIFDSEGYAIVEIVDDRSLEVLVGVRALEALGFIVDPITGTLKKSRFDSCLEKLSKMSLSVYVI